MAYQTAKNVESVWNELNQKIEYQASTIFTSKENRNELSVRTIVLQDDSVCEIVSHTYSDNTNTKPIQEIIFYSDDESVNVFKDKTIEQTINIVIQR